MLFSSGDITEDASETYFNSNMEWGKVYAVVTKNMVTDVDKVTCKRDGITFKLLADGDSDQLQIDLYNSWTYANEINSIVWTEPYADAATGNDVITVMMAVYDVISTPDVSHTNVLVGVAGVDVNLEPL